MIEYRAGCCENAMERKEKKMQIVFSHGLGQGASSWDQVLSCMGVPLEARCPALFSLTKGQAANYENLYRAFSRYCDQLPRPLHLCGLSLGALLALQYGAEHPERTASLALIGAQYRVPKALIRLQNAAFRLMPEKSFGQMGLAKADLIALASSMAGLDFSQILAAIACPTLVLCGERDGANRRAAQALARGIPGARFELVNGAGHEANVDAPQALAKALTGFYQRLEDNGYSVRV